LADETKEMKVEPVPVEEVKPASAMSDKELKEALTFQEDAKLHPTGEPDDPGSKAPGGFADSEPNNPPYKTNHPDEPILTALATGSGAHTPPNPDEVDADGYSRPKAGAKK
jgi:hypothetical protein